MTNLTSILDALEAGRDLELRRALDNTFPMLDTISLSDDVRCKERALTNTLRLIRDHDVMGSRTTRDTRHGEPRFIFVMTPQESNTNHNYLPSPSRSTVYHA